MIPALVVFLYLAVVLYIGIFAFRTSRTSNAEDYFLAGRSLGPTVFLLSLFGTNMTAFSILGASGHAFANGIVTFGLMASSSALVIPVCLFAIGTRLWALGKRNHFMTPVQMFRDRWECRHIGTVIFIVQAALLVPYIIISVMGGGTVLRAITGGVIPYEIGGAIVSAVVTAYVFLGGMRGTAWVNALQTTLFLLFGTIAAVVIGGGMGGFREAMEALVASPATSPLLTRERVSPLYFFSYTFIPLSSIAFPHICIFCLTARNVTYFRKTIVLYPICMLFIWLPSVFLGVGGESRNGRSGYPDETRSTRAARGTEREPDAGRSRAAARRSVRRRRDFEAGRGIRAALARSAAGRRGHGSRHGERLADTRAVDDVYRGHLRVLSGHRTLRSRHAGDDGTDIRRPGHRCGVPHRAAHPAVDLRRRDAVRVCRVRCARPAARRRAVLEGQHALGRAGHHPVDGSRGRRLSRSYRTPSLPHRPVRRSPCGRSAI